MWPAVIEYAFLYRARVNARGDRVNTPDLLGFHDRVETTPRPELDTGSKLTPPKPP